MDLVAGLTLAQGTVTSRSRDPDRAGDAGRPGGRGCKGDRRRDVELFNVS